MSTQGWYPFARKLPITTKEYSVQRSADVVSVVDHISDGSDSRNWLQNVDNGSSTHFLIREEDGRVVVYQFMPVEWVAWGNGRYSTNNPFMPAWARELVVKQEAARTDAERWKYNINQVTVSIEHERKWPFTTPLPEAMTVATIELHLWLCDNYPTIIPDRNHIIGHYQIDHVSRANCPGGAGGKLFPFDRIVAALTAPAQPPAQLVVFPETGVAVAPDFYDFWQRNGGLPIFGYPVKPEAVGEGGLPVQSFERARFERHPDGTIKLGLVEAERLRLLGQL